MIKSIIPRVSMTLFFCLFSSLAYAANSKPEFKIVSLSPGPYYANKTITITTYIYDADGWQNIRFVSFSITNNRLSLYGSYNQNTDKLYLSGQGGHKPGSTTNTGSANIIETPLGKLNCTQTTVLGRGNYLTIRWAIILNSQFVGPNININFYAFDDANAFSGIVKKGPWELREGSVDTQPPRITITPVPVYTNKDVVLSYDIKDDVTPPEKIKVSITVKKDGSPYPTRTTYAEEGRYEVTLTATDLTGKSSTTPIIFTIDKTPPVPPTINPVTSPTDRNSQTIGGTKAKDAVAVAVTANPTSVKVGPIGYPTSRSWFCELTNLSPGDNVIVLTSQDAVGNPSEAYATIITYSVNRSVNRPPRIGTVVPSSGTSYVEQAVTFITTYSDPDGWEDIFSVSLVMVGPDYLEAEYNQNTNMLSIWDGSKGEMSKGFAPGTNNIIENAYFKLDCSLTSVRGSATTLIIKWNITFKSTFVGSSGIFLMVMDDGGLLQDWTQKGTWTIQATDIIPPTGSITINDNLTYTKSPSVTLNLSSQDNPDGSGLDKMRFSNDGLNWSAPEAYATTKSWVLSSGNGEKKVYARFSDKAGSWSEPVYDTIILNTRPLQITAITPADGSTFYENDTVVITILADDIDISSLVYQFSIAGAVKQPWSSSNTYQWQTSKNDIGSPVVMCEVKNSRGEVVSKTLTYKVMAKPVLTVSVMEVDVVIGTVTVGSETVSSTAVTLTNNTPGHKITYALSLVNPLGWVVSQHDPGPDTYVLNATFSDDPSKIRWNNANHALSTTPVAASTTKFAADQTGVSVLYNETRKLWFQFKAPTSTTVEAEQRISVMITAQVSY